MIANMRLPICLLLALLAVAPAAWAASPVVADVSTPSVETTAVTDHTANLPPNIAVGDMLILVIVRDASQSGGTSTISGWTSLGSSAGNAIVQITVRCRIATGSEGSTLAFQTSAVEESAHIAYRITGHAGDCTTASVEAAFANGTSATPDPPSLDPATWDNTVDTLWIAGAAGDGSATPCCDFSGFPASYGTPLEATTGGAGGAVAIATAHRALAATSEDPGTFNHGGGAGDEWATVTIAIKGTAAAGSGLCGGMMGVWSQC